MSECKDIFEQLSSDDVGTVRDGAYHAGETRCESAIPALVGLLRSHNLGIQEAADHALRKIGGRATVLAVAPMLRSEDAPARNIAMDILREVGHEDFETLQDLVRDEDTDIRIFAADILGSTGDVRAVTALCKALLQDPEVNVRYQAAVSLGNLAHPEAARCLQRAMNDEEWVQFAVIEALTRIRDETSVTALAKSLDKSTDLVASMIVEALGEMSNVKAVPLLLKRLGSSPMPLRNKIIKAVVGILGPKALTLLPDSQRKDLGEYLLSALRDEDESIQDAAIVGLSFVGGERAAGAVLALAESLDPVRYTERLERMAATLVAMGFNQAMKDALAHGSWKQGMLVLQTLVQLQAQEVAPLLMALFWTRDLEMQRALARALVEIAGDEARDFFVDVLGRHNDGDVLKAAVAFLGERLKSEADADAIFALLEHPYDDVKEAALDACVAIGGEHVRSRFKELFHSPEPVNRLMATFALGRLGVRENLDEIRLALEDEVPDIRKVAIQSLTRFCDFLEDDLPLVVPRLQDEVKEVRLAVVELLGGCPEAAVMPYLYQALADDDEWVEIRALEALSARSDREVVSRIVPLLDSPHKLVRLKAVEALGVIGGQVAFRALLDVLNGDDYDLVAAAEDAIAKIQAEQGDIV